MERTLQDFLIYLHNNRRSSFNTEIAYQRDLVRLIDFLQKKGIRKFSEVTEADLQDYLNSMKEEEFAPSTISRSTASIRALFRFLFRMGRIQQDPSENLKPPRVERKASQVLSLEEVDKLLTTPNTGTPKGMRDAAMLELLYATGMRVSELIHLKMEDLDLDMGYVVCRENGKERTLPIGNPSRNALIRYLENARDDLVKSPNEDSLFTNCSGTAMSRQGFWKVLKSYAEEAGIEGDITPHTLRHSFAVHMIDNGADMRVVQEMLGHSDITSTQAYMENRKERLREAYLRSHPRQ